MKINGTAIAVSTTAPASYDKAGFEAMDAADWTSVDCQLTSIGNITLEYDTSTDEAVFCVNGGSPLTVDDLEDLKAGQWEITGKHVTNSAFQNAVEAIFFSKADHYIRITHPSGANIWVKVKQKKFDDQYGDTKATRKFAYSYLIRDLPVKS